MPPTWRGFTLSKNAVKKKPAAASYKDVAASQHDQAKLGVLQIVFGAMTQLAAKHELGPMPPLVAKLERLGEKSTPQLTEALVAGLETLLRLQK